MFKWVFAAIVFGLIIIAASPVVFSWGVAVKNYFMQSISSGKENNKE